MCFTNALIALLVGIFAVREHLLVLATSLSGLELESARCVSTHHRLFGLTIARFKWRNCPTTNIYAKRRDVRFGPDEQSAIFRGVENELVEVRALRENG